MDDLQEVIDAMESSNLNSFVSSILWGRNVETCPLKKAIEENDRDLALNLIKTDGLDPFGMSSGFQYGDSTTAFHEASARGDIEMLLAMAAKPGTLWTKRFVVSRNQVMDVPVKGRDCIPSVGSNTGNFFYQARISSPEGLEVMLMYGYSLKIRDFEYALPWAFVQPDKFHKIFRLCYSCIGLQGSYKLKFERCLGMAIGGSHGSFINGSHPTCHDLARTLLKAGADPNGYCFQGDTPYDFIPAVFQAIANHDEAMTKLLLSYGVDVNHAAQISEWTSENRLNIKQVTIHEKATENNMIHLLKDLPEEPITADPSAFQREIRKELESDIKKSIQGLSAVLVVAMMKSTGKSPPVGLMSQLILNYCPLNFNLWKIGT